ncbi:MAG: ABC transporter ATP-binding protein [Candidatus Kapaibacterium sp.]
MSILIVENLSKVYRKKKVAIPALNGVSFEVARGEFVTVVGRSGSGKSTLLNLIGGLDTPDTGEIVFDGERLPDMSRKALELHRRNSVGMIFQSFNLISYRSALDNVTLPMVFTGIPRSRRKDIARELLESVGLAGRINHKPSEMSGGEAQRVAIARAMANNPKMLLADEPTGNLDTNTASEIMALLEHLNRDRGITILMITHEMEIATRVSDRIITLKDGRILTIEDNRSNGGANEAV